MKANRIPTTERVFSLLHMSAEPMLSGAVQRALSLTTAQTQAALIQLLSSGRVDRSGTRHSFRYFTTNARRASAGQLASVSHSMLPQSVPEPVVLAAAPIWPRPSAIAFRAPFGAPTWSIAP